MKSFSCLLLVTLFLTGCGNSEEKLIKLADKIHESILTVDTHCDTPMEFSDPGFDLGVKSIDGCVDFPKMSRGTSCRVLCGVHTTGSKKRLDLQQSSAEGA